MRSAILSIDDRYPPEQLRTATRSRRLAGWVLDGAIGTATVTAGLSAAAVAPPLVLIAFGWLAWFAFVAPRAQTPAKQLLGMHLVLDDGARASTGRTWLREVVLKNLVFGGLLIWPLAALFLLFDERSQAWWDKLAGTHVAYSPNGFVPPLTPPEPRSL